MKALITGASYGIGRDIARVLDSKGYNLILSARSAEKLNELNKELGEKHKVISLDLSEISNCKKLYEELKNEDIDILVNNAGFGVFGQFTETDLDKELNMIDLNIKTLHYLTKVFIKDFVKKNNGHILNVASIAGFMPGPLLSSYYASKAYVLRLSLAIDKELRKQKSDVKISVLCPGPVKTAFDERAGVKFSLNGLDSKFVAEYAIEKMLKNKVVIIPGTLMKFSSFFSKITPNFILTEVVYHSQRKKL